MTYFDPEGTFFAGQSLLLLPLFAFVPLVPSWNSGTQVQIDGDAYIVYPPSPPAEPPSPPTPPVKDPPPPSFPSTVITAEGIDFGDAVAIVTGGVGEIRRGGRTIRPGAGELIYRGDVIKTDRGEVLEIELEDGRDVDIEEETKVPGDYFATGPPVPLGTAAKLKRAFTKAFGPPNPPAPTTGGTKD